MAASSYLEFGAGASGWSRTGWVGDGSTGLKTIDLWGDSGTSLRFGANNLEVIRVDASGTVGIGTATPNQGKVEVKGGSVCVDTNSDDNASQCIASESDARLKQNVKPLIGSLDLLTKLRGVSFDWRVSDSEVLKHYPLISRFAANPHSVGVIAQEVEKIFPYAVEAETVGDNQVQYKQVDYAKFTPL